MFFINKQTKLNQNPKYMNIELLCKEMLKKSYDTLQYKVGQLIKNETNYPYIPVDEYRLSIIIKDLIKSKIDFKNKSFIDIGCGVPIIPKIFKILGCKESSGLEFEELYCRMDHEKYLIHGDLTTFNFKDYDILYSFNPIRNSELMEKGLNNIMTTMKEGSVLYFIQAGNISKTTLNKFTKIKNESIFKFKK